MKSSNNGHNADWIYITMASSNYSIPVEVNLSTRKGVGAFSPLPPKRPLVSCACAYDGTVVSSPLEYLRMQAPHPLITVQTYGRTAESDRVPHRQPIETERSINSGVTVSCFLVVLDSKSRPGISVILPQNKQLRLHIALTYGVIAPWDV